MSRSFRQLGVCLCVLASVILLQVSVAQAQTLRGPILGTVTDSSGAAVSGAQVTIKNVDTGLTRTVTTADDGSYSAPAASIGKRARRSRAITRCKVLSVSTTGMASRRRSITPITTTADAGPGYPFLGGGGPRSIQIAAKINF